MLKHTRLMLGVVLLVSFIARFIFLPQVPFNLADEEVAIATNASSIVRTGRDLLGHPFPLIWEVSGMREFPVFGGLVGLSSLIFGMNEFATRLPSGLFGALTPLLVFLLAMRLFSRRGIAFAASLLLAVSPWHIHLSRWANASPVVVFFLTLGLERFFAAKERRQFPGMTMLCWTAALLTDMVAWIVVPMLMVLFFLHQPIIRRHRRLWMTWFALFLGGPLGLFFSNPDNQRIAIERSIFSGASFSMIPTVIGQFLENLFAMLSFELFFFRGDDFSRHSLADIGILYIGALPFFFLGTYVIYKRFKQRRGVVFSLLLLTSITAALSRFAPDIRTFLFAAIPIHLLLGVGVTSFFDWARRLWWRRAILIGLIVILSYNVIFATHLYFVHYARQSASTSTAAFKSMWQFIANHMETYDRIIISKRQHANTYLHGLFHLDINPGHFQKTGSKDGFDYFTFGDLSLEHFSDHRILLIAEEDYHPGIGNEVARFTLVNGNTVFVAWDIQR